LNVGEGIERFEKLVKPMHELHIQPQREKADFVLDGSKDNEFENNRQFRGQA